MFSSKTTWLDCKLKIIAKNHSQPCLLLIESLRIKKNASQLVYTFFINSVTRPDSQIGGRTLADDGHHVQRDHHTHTHAGAYRFSCWGTCNEVMSQICIALSCWFFYVFFVPLCLRTGQGQQVVRGGIACWQGPSSRFCCCWSMLVHV